MYDNAAVVNFYNPYKHRSINYSKMIRISALLTVFGGWIALLIYLPYFRVNNIEITGTDLLSQSEIKTSVESNFREIIKIIPGNNILFVNTDRLAQNLKDEYNLESASVTKILPNYLKIQIGEKKMAALVITETKIAVTDKDGKELRVLQRINSPSEAASSTVTSTKKEAPAGITEIQNIDTKFKNLPVIFYSDLNSEKLSSRRIAAITEGRDEIEKGTGPTEFKIKYAELMPEGEVVIYTDKSWKILCTDDRPLRDQIDSAFKILKNSTPVDYIDVRMVDRVFWK